MQRHMKHALCGRYVGKRRRRKREEQSKLESKKGRKRETRERERAEEEKYCILAMLSPPLMTIYYRKDSTLFGIQQ